MKIVHISAECYPIAKVGGLADVVGALPKYQNGLGHQASVLMPFYNIAFIRKHKFKSIFTSSLTMGRAVYDFDIKQLYVQDLGFDLFLVNLPELIFKEYVYSEDDSERFLAFQMAALTFLKSLKSLPEVVHCHDHHTGLIPFMMQYATGFEVFQTTPSILTIHNAQYQGWFSHQKIDLLPDFDSKHTGLLDWDGSVNPLAAAIKCAWRVTTVSPSYMEELKSAANGLESLLRHESAKCTGILNGIDTGVWNAESDPYLIKNYTVSNNWSGKRANKKWLCDTYNLDADLPLLVFIGRLVHEKGTDLFPEVFEKALREKDISLLLLGSGDPTTEQELNALKERFSGNYNAHIGYDEKLSHQIYAGADFLLMPSRVEPCGLNQMYALRYGTIPVVRSIGGLKDTIVDIEEDGFGILHQDTTVPSILDAIAKAKKLYKNPKEINKIRKQIMNIDHSWNKSADTYIQLYNSVTN